MAAQILWDNMDEYLEHGLEVYNDEMRDRIQVAGFSTLPSLVKRKPDFAHKVCQVVRKSTGGVAEEKDVSVDVEEGMRKLILFARYTYLVQREMEYDLADVDNLDELDAWFDQLKKNEPTEPVAPFSEGANKKAWFESILSYLGVKTGESGVPLLYVLREEVELPTEDPGFGTPSFDEEVQSRGRHNGHFWRGDNKMVWLIVKGLTEGTSAWTTVKSYARSNDGRGAFMALSEAYMGVDIKLLLMKKAETVLANAVFDGKSKSWTWTKHIGKLKESFEDMAASGQELTGRMQVTKLLATFQFEPLKHLASTIETSPEYRDNFQKAAAFIQGQINALRLKNGSTNRTLASMETFEDDDMDLDTSKETTSAKLKKVKRKLKQVKSKLKMAKKKNLAAKFEKTNKATKFSKNNPGAYIPAAEWKKLTPEQQAEARKAREADGIPTRRISALIGGKSDVEDKSDGENGLVDEEEQPHTLVPQMKTIREVPKHLLKAPHYKKVDLTQRSKLYKVAQAVVSEEDKGRKVRALKS